LKNILLTLFLAITIYGQTIKDISNIVGIRENQLIGYGLVVGSRSGGDGDISSQTLTNLLRNANIKIDDEISDAGDTGAVIVTAALPPFARQGDKIKIEVASLDGANLDGAKLLVTQLKGVDGKVYALAQGTILGVTNEAVRGRRDSESKTGYIYDGAIVENEIPYDLNAEKSLTLSLLEQNAKIAALIEKKVNEKYSKFLAVAYDTRTIKIKKPENMSMVRFIAEVQDINIDVKMKKKIIIDPVKEIIIAGADITVSPVTISRENFTIRIKKSNLSDKEWNDAAINKGKDLGDDIRVEQLSGSEVDPVVIDIDNALVNTQNQPTVSDIMRAMKMMKVDITEIIETIKMLDSLGAINADVEMVR
jgi:flagellar P-ring protein precursor FlgI